ESAPVRSNGDCLGIGPVAGQGRRPNRRAADLPGHPQRPLVAPQRNRRRLDPAVELPPEPAGSARPLLLPGRDEGWEVDDTLRGHLRMLILAYTDPATGPLGTPPGHVVPNSATVELTFTLACAFVVVVG